MASIPTFPRWQMHDVRDWEQLYVAGENGTETLNLVTATLINYTLVIGVSEITDDNIDEVSCRIALLEAVHGPSLRSGTKNIFMTRDDVARHVGLRTEATNTTPDKFWTQMRARNREERSMGHREANGNCSAFDALYQCSTP